VALDGIAVFLNKDNPVKELTIAQLKALYTGSVHNWKEVGGADAPVILYGRENNSGTYVFFKEHVMDGEDYAARTQTLPGTSAVVHAVANDKNGIGYGGLAWATDVKFAGVKVNDTAEAVKPSIETVSGGTYPISRELYWFFNGQPEGELKKLTNWVLSEDGQKLAEKIDYVPLSQEKAKANMID
jgi:phosphate transport system substrate-binding protein